ncbi:MAG: DUF4185 domain-containing protein [Deltaproteobacteria bacterium]|nr:DUF4185 domain-containing protein [Deltaproteobacteria bacterium]
MATRVALVLVVPLALATSGCAWSLDEPAPLQAPGVDAGVPMPPACALLAEPARGLVGARGRVRTLRFPDGSLRLIADTLQTRDGAGDHSVGPVVLTLTSADAAGCLLPALPATLPTTPPTSALDVSPLGAGTGQLLGVAVSAGRPIALVETLAFINRIGIAAATWDDARGVFVAAASYLFTGDRAGFGDAVLVEDGFIYAYGCRNVGFLRDACYLARAPEAGLADPTAYTFYRAGGSFGPDLEDAWPLFDGGSGLAVLHRGARYYALYLTPLGDTIQARSGLSPSGPWSAPVVAARCVPPGGGFCTGLAVHPELAARPDHVWVSHAVASFDPLSPEDASSRLMELALTGLP